jgi:hypothetical protein
VIYLIAYPAFGLAVITIVTGAVPGRRPGQLVLRKIA